MTIEEQIQIKVNELLIKVNDSIPSIWNELFIHLEMDASGGTIYFFFKEHSEKDFHYSLQIPNEFSLPKQLFSQQYREQFKLGQELWNIFSQNNLEVWTNATISVIDGKMNLVFDYTPWIQSKFGPTDTLYYFMYKYLDYFSDNEEEKQKFNEMEEFQKKHKS